MPVGSALNTESLAVPQRHVEVRAEFDRVICETSLRWLVMLRVPDSTIVSENCKKMCGRDKNR